MTAVTLAHGIAGAATATGATIVIDTFRAFTTAAVLLDRGVKSLILCSDVWDARRLATEHRALLCGEVGGVRPKGFDLGNSPVDALNRTDLAGTTVVQRTSSGTRSVIAAINSGATPVFAASLVVARATARAAASEPEVIIVSAGQDGIALAAEDDITAAHIAAILQTGIAPPDSARRIAGSDRARQLASSSWAHEGDVEIALDTDRFSFAMQAIPQKDSSITLAKFE